MVTADVVPCTVALASQASALIAVLAFSAVLNTFPGHTRVVTILVQNSHTLAPVLFGSYNPVDLTRFFPSVQSFFNGSQACFCSVLSSQYVFSLKGAFIAADSTAPGVYAHKLAISPVIFPIAWGTCATAHPTKFLAHSTAESK